MISSASARNNTVLFNCIGEAQAENAQGSVSSDKGDVYEGPKVTAPAQGQAQAAKLPAKEAQAQAQACQAQQGQQAQGAARKKSRFSGLFGRKSRAKGPSKRQTQKQLDAQVKALVRSGGAKGCNVSVAHLVPRSAAAGKGCQVQSSCKSEAANLHMLAKSVIKYTHTGLHLHAVSKCNAASALSVVRATLAEINPHTVDTKECNADRKLKHDRKRLERHEKHLQKKASRAAAKGACGNAKGIADQCAAPAKIAEQGAAKK